ncbi:MAG TPA: NUDIX domain-containing protein [Candidatus Saccharimonadales bacterium]|nr:NUDIX domain-containing protein [Candidatus Saccharimonadales bacterium]
MTILDDQQCSHCGRWKNRGVTVDALLIWRGQILLMERAEEPYQGYLALPGGWLETDHPSTAFTAALELLQETGVKGINPTLVGVFDNPERHPEQAISIAISSP